MAEWLDGSCIATWCRIGDVDTGLANIPFPSFSPGVYGYDLARVQDFARVSGRWSKTGRDHPVPGRIDGTISDSESGIYATGPFSPRENHT